MNEIDFFAMFYTTLGGLGLFFLGLSYLSESLQSLASNFIKKLINVATSNRITAVVVGIILTAIVQSSSISTVMVVGLVNAGLMNLMQAIGVILGANIGTTITGWILVIKIGKYGLLLIGLGIFPMLFSKKTNVASIGKCILAMGLIFQGLSFMSSAFKPLRTYEPFISNLELFDAQSMLSVLGCIAIGCVLTVVIQSSSAMLGITIALASTGSITYPTAAALVFGENIGTTITALLASVGANTSAKRAAYSHAIFNIFGVSLMILIFQPYISFIDSIVPGLPDSLDSNGTKPFISAHIAMVHTFFNVTATIAALPLIGYIARAVTWLVPSSEKTEARSLKHIHTGVASNSEVALNMVELELGDMFKLIDKLFLNTKDYLSSKKNNKELLDKIYDLEEVSDKVNAEVREFCCSIIEGEMTQEQSYRAYALNRVANEVESIADYCLSISKYKCELYEKKIDLSKEAWEDIYAYFNSVYSFYSKASKSISPQSQSVLKELKQEAMLLKSDADKMKGNHLARMKNGSCNPIPAIVFSDIAVSMRRVKNHSVNLIEAINRQSL